VLKVQNLDVSIQSVQILRGVTLELAAGTMTGLIGRNGAGKTTFMKTVMGLLKFSRGSILWEGDNLGQMHTHERTSLGIGYMPEDRRLIPDLTVEDNLLVPAWALKRPDARERLKKVHEYIPELVAFGPRKGTQLSGGQQKLAALGRALMCGTKLLLLDEPFEGVAPLLARRLADVIGGLKKEGMTILVSESDLQHSERMVDRIVTIDRGVVKA
jgi:branched-chain amino acid transport system ATP-binding protein